MARCRDCRYRVAEEGACEPRIAVRRIQSLVHSQALPGWTEEAAAHLLEGAAAVLVALADGPPARGGSEDEDEPKEASRTPLRRSRGRSRSRSPISPPPGEPASQRGDGRRAGGAEAMGATRARLARAATGARVLLGGREAARTAEAPARAKEVATKAVSSETSGLRAQLRRPQLQRWRPPSASAGWFPHSESARGSARPVFLVCPVSRFGSGQHVFFQAVVTLADPNCHLSTMQQVQQAKRVRAAAGGSGCVAGSTQAPSNQPVGGFPSRGGFAPRAEPGCPTAACPARAGADGAHVGDPRGARAGASAFARRIRGRHADRHAQCYDAFSPRAPGEVAPTAPDVATPGFTPTAAPAHWHGVGPPTAAPGVRLSWLYVPLLHAAAGNFAPEADAAWRSAPGTGATWAAIVATLRDGPPVDPQLLARMAHQAAEAEVAAGEATEPELAPALARARALGRLLLGGSALFQLRCGGVCTRSRAGSADGGLWGSPSPQCDPYSRVRSPADVGGRCPNCARSTSRAHRRREAQASPRAEAPGVQRDTASPPSANPVRRVPSAAAWRALDDVDLATEFRHPVATLQDVPGFLRSALRAALVQALRQVRAAHDASRAGDPAACARAWKLFVLATQTSYTRGPRTA